MIVTNKKMKILVGDEVKWEVRKLRIVFSNFINVDKLQLYMLQVVVIQRKDNVWKIMPFQS